MKKKAKIAFGKLDLLRNDQLNNKNKINIGFVGGGPNSFIGYTHRLAARFDNRFNFVAGVFAGTSHNVTFELRDNNSQVIQDKTIFLQTGLNTLQLDFEMPIMNDLELGVSGTGSDLFRNNSGAYYPYPIGNLATITGHNSPYPGDTNYHYFFYNLKVQESCLSNFSPAEAVFMSPSEVKDNKNSDVTIYPNPAKDNFYVISPRQLNSIEVFDISGKRCFIKTKNLIDPTINIKGLSQGIYTVKVVDEMQTNQVKLFVD